MPSPFPGMNPYLEQPGSGHNFHQQFCNRCLDVLVPQVRPAYFVKLDENVYIHELGADQRLLLGRPDVSVATVGNYRIAESAAAAIKAPTYGLIPPAVDFERDSFLEIRDTRSRSLVTVIELLSPANKDPGPDRDQYLAKRRQILRTPVHLVEIDLLRGGVRMPVEDFPDCDYAALVSRTEERPRVGIWPVKLRERLPVIPIPLRAEDQAASIDLQLVLDHVYDAGAFGDYIYTGSPSPPLHPDDATWANGFVPERP